MPRRFRLHSSAARLLEQIRHRRASSFRHHWESRSLSTVGAATGYDGNTVRPMVTAPNTRWVSRNTRLPSPLSDVSAVRRRCWRRWWHSRCLMGCLSRCYWPAPLRRPSGCLRPVCWCSVGRRPLRSSSRS